MNLFSRYLIFIYVGAVLIQGYLAGAFLMAVWSKAMNATEVALLVDDPAMRDHKVLTFDAIEPAAGK